MRISVLDHGYVEFIEAWGHGRPTADKVKSIAIGDNASHMDMEAGIIEAARQSTQGSFRGWDQDSKLLQFLYSHKHFTPFEFAGMVIEVQAPIFVFREWHRHRTQSYNEMSARYAPLPDLYYIPDPDLIYERMRQAAATNNKQMSSVGVNSYVSGKNWLAELQGLYKDAEVLYKSALDSGIPKELARLSMPVGHYSRMRASANLRNWLAFMTLRCDPNAQWEIRQFAGAVSNLISRIFPRTFQLWLAEANKDEVKVQVQQHVEARKDFTDEKGDSPLW